MKKKERKGKWKAQKGKEKEEKQVELGAGENPKGKSSH
jgi:hypothetical protein